MIDQKYFNIVKKHFNDDADKAWEWFKTIHYKFGMLSPLNAIKLGREKSVMKFIENELR